MERSTRWSLRLYHKNSAINQIQPYDDIRVKDLSDLDLRNQSDLLYTLSFDTYTEWPNNDKMPKDFDPNKLLE